MKPDWKCSCDWCATIERVRQIVAKLPEDDATWLWAFMEHHEGVAMDLNWYQAISDGSWPQSEEILNGWLEALQARTTNPDTGPGSEDQGA